VSHGQVSRVIKQVRITPIYKPWSSAIWKGSHNPFRGLTITNGLQMPPLGSYILTHLKSIQRQMTCKMDLPPGSSTYCSPWKISISIGSRIVFQFHHLLGTFGEENLSSSTSHRSKTVPNLRSFRNVNRGLPKAANGRLGLVTRGLGFSGMVSRSPSWWRVGEISGGGFARNGWGCGFLIEKPPARFEVNRLVGILWVPNQICGHG